MSFSALLNSEMSVMLSSMSLSPYGGQTPVLSTIYSAQPCRINQLSMSERDILSRRGVEASHKVFCEANLTMLASYQIVIEGLTYQITGYDVLDGALSAHHQEIITRRLSAT